MEIALLEKAWQNFVEDKIIPPDEIIRPIIRESWIRCSDFGVSPRQRKVSAKISGTAFKQVCDENRTLITIALPYMHTLLQVVKESEFVISLANADGTILKVLGNEETLERLGSGNFVAGANWQEKNAGTNGIGTALFLKAPVQIFSFEHYCRWSQAGICSSAPIKDWQYNIIGFLTLTSSDSKKVNSHTLGMVVAAAYAIENGLIMMKSAEECRTANEYKDAIMDSISQGILTIDHAGRITQINSIAQDALGLEKTRSWIGLTLSKILPEDNAQLYNIIHSPKRVTDKEININTSNGSKKYNVTTRIINSNDVNSEGLILVIDEIARARKLAQRVSGLYAAMTFDNLIGDSKEFLNVVEVAKNVAGTNSIVLLTGETGTGKDILAQAIHNDSSRAKGPFVPVNCGAIPKDLIASELFGYSEGAFTGARKGGNLGKFELADRGTLFLDEIGDMPLDLQANLLRVLEEKRIMRIGGSEIIPIDVRIIAATNKNLLDDVKNGSFRQDLYYRLNVVSIRMPSLRERAGDISKLTHFFYEKLSRQLSIEPLPIPDDFVEILSSYSFPGNIRELQNEIERCVIFAKGGKVKTEHLSDEIRQPRGGLTPQIPDDSDSDNSPETNIITNFEKQKIVELMIKYNNNITKVAKELHFARSTLYRKLNAYGILPPSVS
ncbi:sigma-54-dependent Fis family transcriptional regulator [Clostridia bacterium]|nr:sigma-54-dependent Fis family transcriptional regulator [Clostridia bacterium]